MIATCWRRWQKKDYKFLHSLKDPQFGTSKTSLSTGKGCRDVSSSCASSSRGFFQSTKKFTKLQARRLQETWVSVKPKSISSADSLRSKSNAILKATSYIRSQWHRSSKSWTLVLWTLSGQLTTQRRTFSLSVGRVSEKEPLALMLTSARNTYVRSWTAAKSLFSKWPQCQTQIILSSAMPVQASGSRYARESMTYKVVAGTKWLWAVQTDMVLPNLVLVSCCRAFLMQTSAVVSKCNTDMGCKTQLKINLTPQMTFIRKFLFIKRLI